MKELDDIIEKKSFYSLNLFYGNENFLKEKYEQLFIDAIINKDSPFAIMNLEIFKENNFTVDSISNAINTVSFSMDKKLVIVKDSGYFTKGKAQEQEKLLQYLEDVNESVVVLFIEKDVDKRNKVYKFFSKNGKCYELETPNETELKAFIVETLGERKKTISNSTLQYFLRNVTTNMTNINSELLKLVDYVGSNNEITNADIDVICSKDLEIKVFEMINAIGQKETKTTLEFYNNMMLAKEPPIKILTLIYRHLNLLLQCKFLSEQRVDNYEIARKIKLPPFAVKQYLQQSKNFTKKVLYKGLEECMRTDLEIKTGQINDKMGVEILIVKFSSQNIDVRGEKNAEV